MHKRTVIAKLHADIEGRNPINRKLEELGLEERISSDTTRSTSLGRELETDWFSVFVGVWDEWDTPFILEQHCLIDEIDTSCICDQLETKDDQNTCCEPS